MNDIDTEHDREVIIRIDEIERRLEKIEAIRQQHWKELAEDLRRIRRIA